MIYQELFCNICCDTSRNIFSVTAWYVIVFMLKTYPCSKKLVQKQSSRTLWDIGQSL